MKLFNPTYSRFLLGYFPVFWRVLILILMSMMVISGCKRDRTQSSVLPHGGGFYLDDQEQLRSRFLPLDLLNSGEEVSVDSLLLTGWEGYEVKLEAQVDFKVSVRGLPKDATLGLYGPRTVKGVWGSPLDQPQVSKSNDLLLIEGTVSKSGFYFILLAPHSNSPLTGLVTTSFECTECEEICPETEVCSLYCEENYQTFGLNECRLCACETTGCTPVCSNNEVCRQGECQLPCEQECPLESNPVC